MDHMDLLIWITMGQYHVTQAKEHKSNLQINETGCIPAGLRCWGATYRRTGVLHPRCWPRPILSHSKQTNLNFFCVLKQKMSNVDF